MILVIFFSGALVFFLGIVVSNHLKWIDEVDAIKPHKSSKNVKSNIRDKTDIEKDAEAKIITNFYD